MYEIVNKLLLTDKLSDKFVLEFHLKQLGVTYSVCEPFINNYKRIQKFKGAGDLNCICNNKLDKSCFPHDPAYD